MFGFFFALVKTTGEPTKSQDNLLSAIRKMGKTTNANLVEGGSFLAVNIAQVTGRKETTGCAISPLCHNLPWYLEKKTR